MISKVLRTIFLIFICFCSFSCSPHRNQFTIWIGGSPQEIDYWQHVVDRFNRSTGSDLQLIRQPTYTDQRKQNLVVSLVARQKDPDLFLMDVVWINQFARSGWLAPLDSFSVADTLNDNVFFPSVVNSVDRIDSTLFALPVFLDVALLYYRTDLLRKYGYENPPETWDELTSMAETIQEGERKRNAGFNGFVWQGAQYEGLVCSFLEFIASHNGSLSKEGIFNAQSEYNADALQFMQNLIHRWKISPLSTFTEMKEEEVRRSFQSGNALFERNWTYAWNLHQQDNSAVKGKVGICLLPHFKNGKSVSTMGGWHIGISKYSDRKKQAEAFIAFVTSFTEQKSMLMQVGWNPARQDLYTDSALLVQIPRLSILREALLNAVARPSLPYYGQISEIIQRNVNDCLAGKATAGEALKKIQEESETIQSMYGAQ